MAPPLFLPSSHNSDVAPRGISGRGGAMVSDRRPVSKVALRLYGLLGGAMSRTFWGIGRRVQDPDRERAFRQLMASQWWTGDRLRAGQWATLARLLEHAYEHVPYYRHVFRSLDARPQDVRTPDDVTRLPILTKEI